MDSFRYTSKMMLEYFYIFMFLIKLSGEAGSLEKRLKSKGLITSKQSLHSEIITHRIQMLNNYYCTHYGGTYPEMFLKFSIPTHQTTI